ncbi:hypothetical protein LTR62_000832 [Meristemomyces frigidus]|uniref:Transcriptional co-activator n=1 Tax=Meristemomyces frigidus TaxID=1508187 RepID=A0AAN7YQT4_9PEZI|nr:hypothetical protein LTR62_000832 [Meristemomyces frigidus]
MDPADLTLPIISPTFASKTIPAPQTNALRNVKAAVPRVDLEAIYTQLKSALADQWTDYKTAVNQFVLGNLNQNELTYVLQPLLTVTPTIASTPAISNTPTAPTSILHLHNALIISICANIYRDPPPTEVAPWVVATDKPTLSSKNASGASAGANDKAEERVKKETMSLHGRDRRRIKAMKEGGVPVNDGYKEILSYHHELAVKPPNQADFGAPQSAGAGLAKTNWDLEIRRRYAQPLASETLEFPTQSDIQNRIEPICAEEGLAGSTQSTVQACAELVEQAAEVFVKEMLSQLWSHVRSNAEGCVQTARYKRRFRKGEEEVERGVVQRNGAGKLPVEMEAQASRRPLDMDDLRVGLGVADHYLRSDRFLTEDIMLDRYADMNVSMGGPVTNGYGRPTINGKSSKIERATAPLVDDPMAIDEVSTWQGSTAANRMELLSVLDDCLAVG